MMTTEQTELLNKMQIAGLPNAMSANPLSMSEQEASDFFKQNLPLLTYMDAQAFKNGEPNTLAEKRFFGVSDSDCERQIKHWMDEQPDFTLVSKPNPKYGAAELWVDYFRQPISQVSLPALEKTFREWELKVQSIPYMNQEDRPLIKVLPAVESQPYYERLKHDEAAKIIEQIRSGKGLPEGYEVGHSNGFDARIDGKYKKLLPLTEDEQDKLLYGDREELSPDAQKSYDEIIKSEFSSVELEPYVEDELVEKGYLCDAGELPNASLRERIKPDVKLVDIQVQKFIGMTPPRPAKEIHAKEFSALECCFDDCPEDKKACLEAFMNEQAHAKMYEVTPEQKQMIRALQAEGKAPKIALAEFRSLVRSEADAYIKDHKDMAPDTFPRTIYKDRTPKEPDAPVTHVYGKINQWELKRAMSNGGRQADYLQREVISDLVKDGRIGTPETKKELLGKIQYLTDEQAKDFLKPFMDQAPGVGLLEKTKSFIDEGKLVMTSNLKTIGDCMGIFRHHRNTDYPMKAALRDLVDNGRLDMPREKIDFVSPENAKKLIAMYDSDLAGKNLKNYITGKIENGELGELNRDLSQHLTIRTGMDLLYAVGNTRERNHGMATPNQINALRKLADAGKIKLDNIDLNHLNMPAASYILHTELGDTPAQSGKTFDYSKMTGPASVAQLKYVSLLISQGSLDLQGRDINSLTKGEASQLIASTSPESRQTAFNGASPIEGPATYQQKSVISELVNNKKIERMSYDDWKNLTSAKANAIISQFSPELVKGIAKSVPAAELSTRKGSITDVQKDELARLIDENKVSRSHKINELSASQSDRLIKAAAGQLPSRMPEPATQKQKDFIANLVRLGKMQRLSSDDWKSLSKQEASELIKNNSVPIASATAGHSTGGMATTEQKDLFRAAVEQNLLKKLSFDEWKSLTSEACEKYLASIPADKRRELERHPVRDGPQTRQQEMPSDKTMEH